jgi:hypothetical protein
MQPCHQQQIGYECHALSGGTAIFLVAEKAKYIEIWK